MVIFLKNHESETREINPRMLELPNSEILSLLESDEHLGKNPGPVTWDPNANNVWYIFTYMNRLNFYGFHVGKYLPYICRVLGWFQTYKLVGYLGQAIVD